MNRAHAGHRAWRARGAGDGGAVLIEFTVVFPFLVILTMGILEFGYAYRSNVIVSDTTAAAARSLANAGDERSADHSALLSVQAGLAALPDDSVPQRVVIYDHDAPESSIDGCRTMAIPAVGTTGVDGVCNVYSWDAVLSADGSHFSGTGGCDPGDWDRHFCPTDRSDEPVAGLTGVGVWLDVEHTTVTNMFPFVSLQMDETRVMHVEPGPDDPDTAAPPTSASDQEAL